MTSGSQEHQVWLTTRSFGLCRLLDVDWEQHRALVAMSGESRPINFEEVTGTVQPAASSDAAPSEWKPVGYCPDDVLVEVTCRLSQAGLESFDPYAPEVRDRAYQVVVQLFAVLGVAAIGCANVYEDEHLFEEEAT